MHESRRSFSRQNYEIPIHYTELKQDHFHESRIYNFSKTGICFKPVGSIEPESRVGIVVDNYSPGTFGPEAYRFYLVRIKWCRELCDNEDRLYDAGAEIMSKSHEVVLGELEATCHLCDLCGRLIPLTDLHKDEDSVMLCPDCHAHFKSFPDGHLKDSIRRFMTGNVI